MSAQSFTIKPELPEHFDEIDTLTRLIFGPGMYARAAYHLREGVMPHAELCFVAIKENKIIGTVRQTQISIGNKPALLLGPLGVSPCSNNNGVGKALMQATIMAANGTGEKAFADLILLVGDHAYYKPFGFEQVAADQIIMPRPVDVGRTLALELREGALTCTSGEARRRIGP